MNNDNKISTTEPTFGFGHFVLSSLYHTETIAERNFRLLKISWQLGRFGETIDMRAVKDNYETDRAVSRWLLDN